MNSLADLTGEEVAALYLGAKTPTSTDSNDAPISFSPLVGSTLPPAAIDWRAQGAVTSVKNQRNCGGCYGFAAAGSLETLNFIKGNPLTDLSPQQILDCSDSFNNKGCSGGYIDKTFQYLVQNGITTLNDYPFIAKKGNCTYDSSQSVFQPTGYKRVTANNPIALQTAVAQVAVSVLVDASSSKFYLYDSGVITADCNTTVNHAVIVVGYNTTDTVPYWTVKNSWGATWCEQGYIRIAIGTENGGKGLCGINQWAYYPTSV